MIRAALHRLIRVAYPYGARRRIQRGPLRGQSIIIGPGMGFTYVWDIDRGGGGGGWDWVRHVPAGSVVYDIGANYGQSTLQLAAAVGPAGRVVALEPLPHVFERLVMNLEANGLGHVTPVCAAASDSDGTAEFSFDADDPSLGRLGGDKTFDLPPSPVSTSVAVLRLDSFRERGWPPPSLLKIDVEGGAEAVFAGAHEVLSVHRPSFYIEIHDEREQAALKHAMQLHRYRATSPTRGIVDDPTAQWVSPLYCEPL